ncbi:MAG: RagB/SusD family nutrient uptake outer membrane protein [Saprospiraceae bacterium]|nr:RagB/SusD family nutrient uptake outer membrane protein [Saprospiraceae bacterium]
MEKYIPIFTIMSLLFYSCESLDTINNNNPDRNAVLSSGADLAPVLRGGYVTWWQGVHGAHPVIALSVTADAYSLPWDDFGAQRFGFEPRTAFNNQTNEIADYKEIAKAPWFGCLSAVSSANDVLVALEKGISIDNGGPQDEIVRASAHFLRGVSWGYIGLIFDKGLIADENTDVTKEIPFSEYSKMVEAAVIELDSAIEIAQSVSGDFVHNYFNGLNLNAEQFTQLCHSYAAKFLAQMPRTEAENADVNWQKVLAHAEKGLNYNFAPMADGKFWKSYQQYIFAETGQGPFWARVDQRLIKALDPSQPARYPEVSKGEAPLINKMATSSDKRLASDFVFLAINIFPTERGEWHFSHYKHNRNKSEMGFAGDGSSTGPMPVFLKADNDLIKAEALLRLSRKNEAIVILNAGTRVTRGNFAPLNNSVNDATVLRAIMYERAIELLSTAPMNLWFDRRRYGPRLDFTALDDLGGLQKGTPAHLPVPADELAIQKLEPYTFGGATDPNGIEAH